MRSVLCCSLSAVVMTTGCTPASFEALEPPAELAFPAAVLEGEGTAHVEVAREVVWDVPYQVRSGRPVTDGDVLLGFDPTERSTNIDQVQRLWTACEVPFEIDDDVRDLEVEAFYDAIDLWENVTPLRFVRDATARNRIRVIADDGCYSHVGMTGGVQDLSLGRGCRSAAIHEIGHAVGLWHEQSRTDRDEHIDLFLDRVPESKRYNFQTYVQQGYTGADVGDYDLDSIMHYGSSTFSVGTCTPDDTSGCSILTEDGGFIARQREELTEGDIAGVAAMYGERLCKLPDPSDVDVGDTLSDARVVALTPDQREYTRQELAGDGDVDVYMIHVTGEGAIPLQAWTEGDIDTVARLTTLGGEVLTTSDDEDDDWNFHLGVVVERGTYVLWVEGHDEHPDGYRLTLRRDEGGQDAVDPMLVRYLEGSGQDKLVEVGNTTQRTLDLTGCTIDVHTNGSLTPSRSIDVEGVLAPTETLLVCNGGLELVPSRPCDLRTGALSFNGDDAVVLTCAGSPVDRIGRVGEDPGTAWFSPEGYGTRDAGLERACGALNDTDVGAPWDLGPWEPRSADDADWVGLPVGSDCGSL